MSLVVLVALLIQFEILSKSCILNNVLFCEQNLCQKINEYFIMQLLIWSCFPHYMNHLGLCAQRQCPWLWLWPLSLRTCWAYRLNG